MAGSGLLIASAHSYLAPQLEKQITINLSSWTSLSDIRIGVAQRDSFEDTTLALKDESFPQEAAHLAFDKPLVKRAPRHHIGRRQLAVAHVAPAFPQPTILVTTHDELPMTQAAVAQAESSVGATESQLEAFQQMHRQLRGQFLTMLHGAGTVITQLATQSAIPAPSIQSAPVAAVTSAAAATSAEVVAEADISENNEEDAPAPVSSSRSNKAKMDIATVADVEATAAAAPVAQTEAQVQMQASATSPQVVSSQVSSAGNVSATQLTSVSAALVPTPATGEKRDPALVTENAEVYRNQFADYDAFRTQTEGTYRQINQLAQQVFGQEGVTTQSMTEAPANVQTGPSGVPIVVSGAPGYSPQSGYSGATLYKMWQAWNSQPHGLAAAPATVAAANPQPTLPAVNALAQTRAVELAEVARDPGPVSDAPQSVVPTTPMVVEAFQWASEVPGTNSQTLTLEGWTQREAQDHWPVIYWNPDAQSQTAMISHNTAVMLAKSAETELQPDAAIVFGKIPAGWDVEYSDRAEKVVYLNAQNQSDVTSNDVRYFAFINAAPGAQLVTLKASLGAETAAVAVPVLNGSSTYLDLTAVTKRAFSGYVLDAGAQTRQGVAGAAVSVVGQPNAVFFATESGYFHLSEVYAVGNYPVYAETATTTGYKHRYRVSPDRMDGVDLYRMGDDQIRTWVGQLEGGVSPESGMIVAAVPGLIQSYGDGRLFPSAHSLLGNATLTPETYTLSAMGGLEESTPLEAAAPRYISVQLPTGPVVSQIEDNNQNVIWSQLVLAQPGVINVVGPF